MSNAVPAEDHYPARSDRAPDRPGPSDSPVSDFLVSDRSTVDIGTGLWDNGIASGDQGFVDQNIMDIVSVADIPFVADHPRPEAGSLDTTPKIDVNVALICTSAGGTVVKITCCTSVSNFPNICMDGTCSCPPASSKEIWSCNCGTGKCWNGTTCVVKP